MIDAPMSPRIEATYLYHSGSDLDVVNAAKVSFGNQSQWADPERKILHDRDRSLIQFLARGMRSRDYDALIEEARHCDDSGEMAAILHSFRDTPIHKSPFNHVFATFHCAAPIFVARQLVKHEYLPWNEISGRYVVFEPYFYVPVWRAANPDKKQGSGGPLDYDKALEATEITELSHRMAYRTYRRLLELGVAEEQARTPLPLNLMTQWRWSGSLHAFASMSRARLRVDAQDESRELASQIDIAMQSLYPVSWRALVRPTESSH